MRFLIDHDLHIHSQLSSCSSDPGQTPSAILEYGLAHGMSHICLTDHFWDDAVPGASRWYQPQNFAHIAQSLPLPQAEGITFHFGCETEMDRFCTLGLSDRLLDAFEFIIIPTTHLHMNGFTIDPAKTSAQARAQVFLEHFDALLRMDLPFHKIGLAHITCGLMANGADCPVEDILDAVPDDAFRDLFSRAARVGMGIELNMGLTDPQNARRFRPYRIAKACGCRFYLGSDAHHPADFDHALPRFEAVIDALELTEDDKFRPFA